MTTQQRLMALEAAACACEYPGIPPDVNAALGLLAETLDQYFNDHVNFAMTHPEFVIAQMRAVELLAKNPQTYC